MHETYWVAYVGIFFVPFCAVCFLIYLEERTHMAKSSRLFEVVVAQVVPEEQGVPHAPDPDAPPYLEPADDTPHDNLYRQTHPASAARMQMPRIYIHAVGLR